MDKLNALRLKLQQYALHRTECKSWEEKRQFRVADHTLLAVIVDDLTRPSAGCQLWTETSSARLGIQRCEELIIADSIYSCPIAGIKKTMNKSTQLCDLRRQLEKLDRETSQSFRSGGTPIRSRACSKGIRPQSQGRGTQGFGLRGNLLRKVQRPEHKGGKRNEMRIKAEILKEDSWRVGSYHRKQDRFALLRKTPKEIFALDKGKFKALPPMTTPVEKRNANKFCEFHGEVGYNTDECMHLRKQIEEMLKAGKLSPLIKEIKQNSGKEQPKVTKKGEIAGKDIAIAIMMVQPWERVSRQRITQSFSPNSEILFPPLGEDEGTEGPMIIEAEIGGHCVHCMYVDGGSASEILGEIIWPIGQIQLLVTIGDEEHSASALMNFVVVSSRNAEDPGRRRGNYFKKQHVSAT
ncbi:hypothetical protein Tco_0438803 [Tanacetum coccineum]